jgi:CDP-Glycerol:Poly(glycerophosphate) glycerophosphotransferase
MPFLAREEVMTCHDVFNVKRSQPHILISIPTGFQLRQFVHSGVLDLIVKKGCRVVIASPNHPGEGFTNQLPKNEVKVVPLEVRTGPLLYRYLAARQHLFLKDGSTDTLRRKIEDLKCTYPAVALTAQLGRGLFRHFPSLRQFALESEGLILRDNNIDKLLSAHPLDLILMGSPGYWAQDAFFLHAAVRRKIPVVAAVMSWDNLSSKGFINPRPDRLLVWSEHMRREAISLHGIPDDRIFETGAPLYDLFANASRFGSRTENLQHLGLDPTRRLIFYGTNHAANFPDEIEVVKRVAGWVEADSLGVPCQLWVRLHPQAVSGPYKVATESYRKLASERVKIEFPPVRDSNLSWDLPANDIEHLVTLLRDADVVINSFSTLSIDAAVLDRPVISIAYDPTGELPYAKSVRRYYDYTHMSHVVRAGAVRLAKSPDDLQRKIISYLERPEQDSEGRRRIVEQQFGRIDGRSALRIVEQILDMMSRLPLLDTVANRSTAVKSVDPAAQ